jgi:hypothetical protein
MTAQPEGPAMWSPDPMRQRSADFTAELVLQRPFEIRLPIADITP